MAVSEVADRAGVGKGTVYLYFDSKLALLVGMQNRYWERMLEVVELIMEAVQVPVIVDAGVGAASDVAVAMEMGVDGVLLNTGIAGAQDPASMARATIRRSVKSRARVCCFRSW